MNFNYVFYGATNDFYKHSFAEMDRLNNACVKGDFYDGESRFLKLLFKAHTYPQFNNKFKIPGKRIWNKSCFNALFQDNKPICFIFEAKYFGQDYFIDLLRKKYPGCKLVLTYRDQVAMYKSLFPQMDMDDIHRKFDLVMSYDKGDCVKYEMIYFDLEASSENLHPAPDYPWSDVLFIGTVKNRLDRVIEAYDILSSSGLNCYFYLVGRNGVKKHGDIIFSNKKMSYAEMLKHTINSRCVLELSQKGEYGFTSRSQEAIMYNKKLITDSLIVREQRFFPSDNIFFINDVKEIDPDFVKKDAEVNYGYKGDYSPIRLLENIESHIS